VLAALGGVILVAGVAGALAFTLGRGGDAEAGGVCRIQKFPSQGSNHVPPAKLPKGFKYNSFPATTGPHHPQTLVFGEYTEPVAQRNLLHNQEHGGVAVQYGPEVPEDVVRRLTDWYRTDPRGLILAPLPDTERAKPLADKIMLSAWWAQLEDEDDPRSRVVKQEGVLGTCSTFDADDFNDFLDKYRAHGPERATLDQLPPGSQ
jgi:uncharacterized protein DUF3105